MNSIILICIYVIQSLLICTWYCYIIAYHLTYMKLKEAVYAMRKQCYIVFNLGKLRHEVQ